MASNHERRRSPSPMPTSRRSAGTSVWNCRSTPPSMSPAPSPRRRNRRSIRCGARKASTWCCWWPATARCLRPGTAASVTADDSLAGTRHGNPAAPARACTHTSRLVSELDSCPLSGASQTQIRHCLRPEKCPTGDLSARKKVYADVNQFTPGKAVRPQYERSRLPIFIWSKLDCREAMHAMCLQETSPAANRG
jgi:hypothetical protein